MKVVYISGSYRNETINGVLTNILKARAVALKYWKRGYAVICPHLNTALMDGEMPDDTWIDGDVEILKRCDIIVMMKGWEQSAGANIELEEAMKLGIGVIFE